MEACQAHSCEKKFGTLKIPTRPMMSSDILQVSILKWYYAKEDRGKAPPTLRGSTFRALCSLAVLNRPQFVSFLGCTSSVDCKTQLAVSAKLHIEPQPNHSPTAPNRRHAGSLTAILTAVLTAAEPQT